MTKAEIWDLIVSRTDINDRNRMRLLEHSTPEDWITRLLTNAIAHMDSTPTNNSSFEATHARTRR